MTLWEVPDQTVKDQQQQRPPLWWRMMFRIRERHLLNDYEPPLWWRIQFQARILRREIREEWARPIAMRIPPRLVYWTLIRALAEVSSKVTPEKEVGLITGMDILEYWETKSRRR
jgi:hypothetical protein